MFFSWRTVYLATIVLRFAVALSDSYIHPDEHFQSLEVLAHSVLGYSTNRPWEFAAAAPARSVAPLYLTYYLPMALSSRLGLSPWQTWYVARLSLMLLSWVVTDYCLYIMLPTKQERIKAIFFVATSYVSLVYQSHTFSNSLETLLVVAAVCMLNELRHLSGLSPRRYATRDVALLAGATGACFALGVFNRVSFPCFFVLPVLYLTPCLFTWLYAPLLVALAFVATAAVCIAADTVYFAHVGLSDLLRDPFNWSQYVVTPLNNLVYNTNMENLAHHGLHPYYQHVLVNLPQLMGPGLVFLLPRLRNSYWTTTPFLAAASGVLFLSLVPHQELRFLTPVVPLLCACFDLNSFDAWSQKYTWLMPLLMNAWLLFNSLLLVLMGFLHQAGVVPALNHLSQHYASDPSGLTIVWWKTYSPPTWMLGNKWNTTQIISLHDEQLDYEIAPHATNYVIDAMGMDFENLKPVLNSFISRSERVYLVTTIASYEKHLSSSGSKETWREKWHWDMDNAPFTNLGTAIYSLL